MKTSTEQQLSPGAASDFETSADRRTAILLAFVLAITFAVYAGALRFQFVYDDRAMVIDNPTIRSWHNLPQLFSEHLWTRSAGTTPNYYRPMFMTWFMLSYALFGLNPVGWHAGVVLLHLIATALVFSLARELLADDFSATVAALIFGLHPIHVEGVAWVTGADNPLMTAFCVASFLSYLYFRRSGPRHYFWLAASLLLYGCGCLSKEPAIMLAPLVAIYEWLTASGDGTGVKLRRAAFASAPFFAVALLYLVQRRIVLRGLGHVMVSLPVALMPLSWPKVLWLYARYLIWPFGLSPLYDTRYVLSLASREFWLPLILLIAIALLLRLWIRTLPAEGAPSWRAVPLFCVAWILLPLLPLLDLVALEPGEMVHDRYLYLPSVGFAILVTTAIRRLRADARPVFGQPAIQVALVTLLAVVLASATARQEICWADELLLFDRAATIAPASRSALNNLANALLERRRFDEGIAVLDRLVRMDPAFSHAHHNLGNAYLQLGRYSDAERELAEAARLSPTPDAFVFLALAQMKGGHPEAAEQNIRTAIRMSPRDIGEYHALALALEQQGRWSEAVAALEQELTLDPNQPNVRAELDAARAHLR